MPDCHQRERISIGETYSFTVGWRIQFLNEERQPERNSAVSLLDHLAVENEKMIVKSAVSDCIEECIWMTLQRWKQTLQRRDRNCFYCRHLFPLTPSPSIWIIQYFIHMKSEITAFPEVKISKHGSNTYNFSLLFSMPYHFTCNHRVINEPYQISFLHITYKKERCPKWCNITSRSLMPRSENIPLCRSLHIRVRLQNNYKHAYVLLNQ